LLEALQARASARAAVAVGAKPHPNLRAHGLRETSLLATLASLASRLPSTSFSSHLHSTARSIALLLLPSLLAKRQDHPLRGAGGSGASGAFGASVSLDQRIRPPEGGAERVAHALRDLNDSQSIAIRALASILPLVDTPLPLLPSLALALQPGPAALPRGPARTAVVHLLETLAAHPSALALAPWTGTLAALSAISTTTLDDWDYTTILATLGQLPAKLPRLFASAPASLALDFLTRHLFFLAIDGDFALRSAALAVLAALGAPLTLTAQIGDNADRPGVVQAPLVPAHLIPPSPALSPEEALTSFRVAPGYRLEIAAAEPLVQEPVFAHFGPDGRLWVVEMRGYMPDLDGQGEDLPTGRIVVLRDRDADGRYDESQVFLDQLVLPRALALVDDGVLIGTPPELAFWRDTDGDGRGDSKEIVATDFGVMTDPKRPFLANPERAPNSLLRHTDNWIYTGAYTRKFRRVGGVWETAPTLFRGQWGLSQDDAGRLYHNSNSDHLRVDVIPSD
jgi:hypothetical protein